jgi:ATP synthase protein I
VLVAGRTRQIGSKMTDEKKPPSRDSFDARLREAQQRLASDAGKAEPTGGGGKPMTGLGIAFRIGTELVAGVVMGTGIGYFLDRWLHTGPWLMVVFFFLGSAAGVLSVYRATSKMGGRKDENEP